MAGLRYPALYSDIGRLAQLPVEEWRRLEDLFRPLGLRKGELFLKPGDDANLFALVLSGLLRFYYIDKNGDEATKAFRGQYEMVAAYSELLTGRSCRAYIEAVEDTKLVTLDYRRVSAFYGRHPSWQELGRKIAERHYIQKEQREFEFLQLSAAERYAGFDRDFPGLAARIPQYHIASYLGITPVALSRIVSGLRKKSRKRRP